MCSEKLDNMPKPHQILEHIVVIPYDQSSAMKMVNEARLDIIAHRQNSYKIYTTDCVSTVRTCHKNSNVWV